MSDFPIDYRESSPDQSFASASWIRHPDAENATVVVFSCVFHVDETSKPESPIGFCVSADQRYQVFLDGVRLGQGPERGDESRWFYERYTISPEPGSHIVSALVWHLDLRDAPGAQISVGPGFLLSSDGPFRKRLTTGIAPWRVHTVQGIGTVPALVSSFCGSMFTFDGATYDERLVETTPRGEGWAMPKIEGAAAIRRAPANRYGIVGRRLLSPPLLPHSVDTTFRAARCRWGGQILLDSETTAAEKDRLHCLESRLTELVRDGAALTVDARSSWSAIIELDTYYCAYPELILSGGEGSVVELGWAEALFEPAEADTGTGTSSIEGGEGAGPARPGKGRRDQVIGKRFIGDFDTVVAGGRDGQVFSPLWWRSGRFLCIRVKSGEEDLVIEDLRFRETRQPIEDRAAFTASDRRLESFISIGFRSLQMCAHETLIDCPYYEQLQYVGDSRLDALVLYLVSDDDRLARKCILQFDEGRLSTGLTRASYPNREQQIIPGFSLKWICMVRDFARYRRDDDFVVGRLPGCRAVLDWFHQYLTDDGVVGPLPYWNFVDWATDWDTGIPPAGPDGASCINSLEYAEALAYAAELEARFGELELAALYRARLSELRAAIRTVFWSEERGMLSDTADHRTFSEHVQALGILFLGDVPESRPTIIPPTGAADVDRMMVGLLQSDDLSRCTIYYSWYLFEALFAFGRYEDFADRMEHWFSHRELGLVTCAETPEPSRSDCHAWGAHPIWHYYSSVAGIRPGDWGFRTVEIRPCIGGLEALSVDLPHPDGRIQVSISSNSGSGVLVTLPPGVTGTLRFGDTESSLQ